MTKRSNTKLKRELTDDFNKKRTVEYQVDTLTTKSGAAAAYYSDQSNNIISNYVRSESEKYNSHNQSAAVLTHEAKHKDNQSKGMYTYALSPEQAYKVNMHDEISANISALIYLRAQYLKTGDINIFKKEYGNRYSFYVKAIESGKINPHSKYREDFDREMRLIANGTRDMWVQQKAVSKRYLKQNSNKGVCYGEINGKHAKYYDQNYERAKKIAYGNIGGVDFTKYMKGDVEIPPKGKTILNNKVEQIKHGKIKPETLFQKGVATAWDFCGVDGEKKDKFLKDLQGKNGTAPKVGTAFFSPIIAMGAGIENGIEKIANMFSSVTNDPINPINTQAPEYREWKNEDGSRVSPVQQKEILDMNKNIIEKPTKSYKKHSNNTAKSKINKQTTNQQNKITQNRNRGNSR